VPQKIVVSRTNRLSPLSCRRRSYLCRIYSAYPPRHAVTAVLRDTTNTRHVNTPMWLTFLSKLSVDCYQVTPSTENSTAVRASLRQWHRPKWNWYCVWLYCGNFLSQVRRLVCVTCAEWFVLHWLSAVLVNITHRSQSFHWQGSECRMRGFISGMVQVPSGRKGG